ncbi:MAG TPA: hypothetical protein PLZ08_08950 [Bacillota bacterium]|nr:hypothetical protein [Bacillota bacterium]HOL10661.1 hypothetical protein [Bacillota bacterium]HPO98064.1 hypothetical protein [Bacillota bacterium]
MIPHLKNYRSSCLILLFSLIVLVGYNPVVTGTTGKKVLLIDIPRLSLNDITKEDCPNLNRLFDQGSVGIMALPVDDPITPAKVYYELNSANKIRVIEEGTYIFDAAETFRGMKAGDLYQALTGYRATDFGGVNIGLAKMLSANPGIPGQNIGLLGEILQRNHIKTAVIGNLDPNVTGFNRSNAALLIDRKGYLDYSAIGPEILQIDSQTPPGFRCDSDAIINQWDQLSLKADMVQITLGDLERVNEFRTLLPVERFFDHRRSIISYYDNLINDLLQKVDLRSTLVIFFSTIGPDNVATSKRINPVLIVANGQFKKGILASNSTRRSGIITGYDLIATSLQHLGVDPKEYPRGRILRAIPGDWHQLQKETLDLSFNHAIRWPLLTGYVYLLLGTVAVFFIGMFFWRRRLTIFVWLERLYLLLLTIPVVFLIVSYFNPVNWLAVIGLTLFLAALIFILITVLAKGKEWSSFWWLSLVTMIVIFGDGLVNGRLQLRSFLGYSAVSGIRFYGLGNEYLGFFLGAYIVVMSLLVNNLKSKRYFQYLVFGLTILLAVFLSHPLFGANIGGGITALVGLGIARYIWLRQPIRFRDILVLVLSLLLFLSLVGIWDLSLNGKATHYGQLINVVKTEGIGAVITIAQRKWRMNMNLINYTPLSYGIIGLLLLAPVLYKKPPCFLEQLMLRYQEPVLSLFSLFFTAIVALLTNDSGIVTVATMFSFGVNLILLLLLTIIKEETLKGVESH